MNVRDLVPWRRNNERGRNLAVLGEESPFLELHREVNRLFDEAFRGFDATPAWSGASHWPQAEVEESENDYRISVELPGVDEKDVEVVMHEGVLVVRGHKRSEISDAGRAVTERTYGRFERRFALHDVDEDRLYAKFHNGVLTIIAPKAPDSRDKARRIPINQPSLTH
ncbi:Hsp20/alpha crystallin family protein [Phenylobacterium montanum]|uniref:Hsp20/alpha crystallin family protein n=1 Tax=Phenylobacterium montanum TaxID=2823693 RepID=A0A975G1Q8_9CAUL|nr:Hsp20/alpha crystallin family protein [Caulobacter sp. S6]QUD89275.1 Hsp20/alpha crystallin family protein [Caulobacter sp. S6]